MATFSNTTPGSSPAVIDLTRPLRGRRNILGDALAGLAGAVILAGAGVAMATPETLSIVDAPAPMGPDAELITLCDALDDLEAQYSQAVGVAKTFEQEQAIDPHLERLTAAQEPLVKRIILTPAASSEGIRAKAQSVVLSGGIRGLDSPHACDRLLASLLSDLVGFEIRSERQAVAEIGRRLGWEGAA